GIGALWPGAEPDPAVVVFWVLAATALLSAVALPALLDRLEPLTLEDHALRWEAMTVLAGTGDISGALDRTRPRPSVGRRTRIPLQRPLVLAVLQRDAIGAIRTPVRVTVACAALLLAGVGWAWAARLDSGPRWMPAVAAGLLVFTALGAFIDGLREAADTAGRPALYGRSSQGLMLLHLPLPSLAAALLPTISTLLAGATWATAALVAVSGALIVAVRAYDAAKGPLPIELMMPVPTPAGDASAIGMWAWQADALLWAAGASFLLFTTTTVGPVAVLWAVPVGLVLTALTAARLRRAVS
ncbi:MAG TPA: hypothetical protein VN241_03725, partial [Microbacterium sp.]|nr:hypothetical protein [Microbacterium sp.]